jgi:hypothetical protein
MRKELKVILIAALAILSYGWIEMPKKIAIVKPPADLARLMALASPESVFAQAQAPAAEVPVNPASLFGAAFYSYATTTGGGAMTMNPLNRGGGAGTLGTNQAMYIYWAYCDNTSSSVTAALIKDGSNTLGTVPCPPSGAAGGFRSFNPPFRMTIGVTPTMTAAAAQTTLYFGLGGYFDLR